MSGQDDFATWWAGLSPRTRWLLAVGAAVETTLKAAALVDLKRRPASQVRGSKWLWASSMIVNSAGLIPISYFAFGRRPAAAAATGSSPVVPERRTAR
jgi:hypothetical protein